MLNDIFYALRGFRRSPGFVFTVVATIGLALGLNTTIFTVFNAYVLRPFDVGRCIADVAMRAEHLTVAA